MKEERKFINSIVGVCILALCIEFIGGIAGAIPIAILTLFIKGKELLFILMNYTATIGSFLAVILYLKYKKEDDILKKLSFKNHRFLVGSLIGLAIGFLLNLICIYAGLKNGNITLSYVGASIPLLIFAFISVAIQSTSEELLCRLFIYEKLKQHYKSPLVWIIVNSSLFGLLHIFNTGATVLSIVNIVIYGLLMSCIIYFFDNIWIVSAIHTAWNFCQNIVFGLPNSGIIPEFSIFKLTNSSESFYYSVSFGVEGSLFCTILLSVVIFIICMLGLVKTRKVSEIV